MAYEKIFSQKIFAPGKSTSKVWSIMMCCHVMCGTQFHHANQETAVRRCICPSEKFSHIKFGHKKELAIKWLYVFLLYFYIVPGCRRRHIFVDGAVRGVYTSLFVIFSCTFRWFRPILSVKLKEENNSNRNNYNDNNNRNGRREVYEFSR